MELLKVNKYNFVLQRTLYLHRRKLVLEERDIFSLLTIDFTKETSKMCTNLNHRNVAQFKTIIKEPVIVSMLAERHCKMKVG